MVRAGGMPRGIFVDGIAATTTGVPALAGRVSVVMRSPGASTPRAAST